MSFATACREQFAHVVAAKDNFSSHFVVTGWKEAQMFLNDVFNRELGLSGREVNLHNAGWYQGFLFDGSAMEFSRN